MRSIHRRSFVAARAAAALGAAAGPASAQAAPAPAAPRAPFTPPAGPRSRVIISNDLGADPDGLFAFVHQVLSTSAEIPLVVGAHALLPSDPFDTGAHEADDAYRMATTMLTLMGKSRSIPAYAGANTGLPDARTPVVTDAARAIVAEAMRTDTTLPLYLTAGGSLTDFASAYLMEPAIAGKATLIWIGGSPYPAGGGEYNLNADLIAAQVLFNDSTIPIWQVPNDVYSMCMVSDAELQQHVRPYGAIGTFLYDTLYDFYVRFAGRINFGEVYQLGDSPLVLLSSLASPWNPTATYTSPYNEIYAPVINADGTYTARGSGRKIRVYTGVDTRLMYHDFFAKLHNNYGQPG
jgi:inosine-uridine preferring nucleoside hydrolase